LSPDGGTLAVAFAPRWIAGDSFAPRRVGPSRLAAWIVAGAGARTRQGSVPSVAARDDGGESPSDRETFVVEVEVEQPPLWLEYLDADTILALVDTRLEVRDAQTLRLRQTIEVGEGVQAAEAGPARPSLVPDLMPSEVGDAGVRQEREAVAQREELADQ
jgi:hypothetical protein